jgi:radical SAM protein with 4Fe4S-binding SPASM domain
LGEHHDKIRGPKDLFKIAVGTFNQLKEIKPQAPNLSVGFITTVMKSNKDRLLELFDTLKNLDPDSIACNIIRDDTKVEEEKEIDRDVCQKFSDRCDEYNNQKSRQRPNLFNRLRQTKTLWAHEIRRKTVETNQFQIPCVAGNKIVVMYAEGEVHPCETLGFEIGNIRDYGCDMKRLLQSERAKDIREKIIKEYCFCTHECFTTASIVFSKKQMAKVLTQTLRST